MKQHLKHRKEAWQLTRQGRLKLAAAGMFLGLACIGSSYALAPAGDSMVRIADDQQQVKFVLTLKPQNQAALSDLLEKMYTPGSANFHQFLSSAEYDAKFAPTQEQYETLKSLATQ